MVRGGKKIYNPKLDKKYLNLEQEKMRKDIKQYLINISLEYYDKNVDHKQHINNILKLKNQIQEQYGHVLFEEKFRFGIAQKLLNLYLKYLWALDFIKSTPPHCPIDGTISKELNSNYRFAISDDAGEYEEVIKKADLIARDSSITISEWETNKFLEANYSQLIFPTTVD